MSSITAAIRLEAAGAAKLLPTEAHGGSPGGSQTYGSASPTLTYTPTSVGLTGSLSCATVTGGM